MFPLVLKAWAEDGYLKIEVWEPVLRRKEGGLELKFDKRRFRLRASDGFVELLEAAQLLLGWLRSDPSVAAQIPNDEGEPSARRSQHLSDHHESDFPVP